MGLDFQSLILACSDLRRGAECLPDRVSRAASFSKASFLVQIKCALFRKGSGWLPVVPRSRGSRADSKANREKLYEAQCGINDVQTND